MAKINYRLHILQCNLILCSTSICILQLFCILLCIVTVFVTVYIIYNIGMVVFVLQLFLMIYAYECIVWLNCEYCINIVVAIATFLQFALLIVCVWIVFELIFLLMCCVSIIFSRELPIGSVHFVLQRNQWERWKIVDLWWDIINWRRRKFLISILNELRPNITIQPKTQTLFSK